MLPFALLILFVTNSIAEFDVKLDLALIFPGTEQGTERLEVRETFTALLDRFRISDEATAVMLATTKPKGDALVQPLTGNKSLFATSMESLEEGDKADQLEPVFKRIKEQFFDKNPNVEPRAKVIVMLLNAVPEDHANAKVEAEKLRKKRVRIYVVYKKEIDGSKIAAEAYTGNPSQTKDNLFSPGWIPVELAKIVADDIKEHLCAWQPPCLFTADQTECKFKAWQLKSFQEYFVDEAKAVKECQDSNKFKPSDYPCPKSECVKQCDARWPWNVASLPDCTQRCSEKNTASIQRKGGVPDGMENCPYEYRCADCIDEDMTLIKWIIGLTVLVVLLPAIGGLVAYCIFKRGSRGRRRRGAVTRRSKFKGKKSTIDGVKQVSFVKSDDSQREPSLSIRPPQPPGEYILINPKLPSNDYILLDNVDAPKKADAKPPSNDYILLDVLPKKKESDNYILLDVLPSQKSVKTKKKPKSIKASSQKSTKSEKKTKSTKASVRKPAESSIIVTKSKKK